MRLKPSKSTIGVLGIVLGLIVFSCATAFWLQRGALARAAVEVRQREAELSDGQQIARQRDAAREALEADRAQIVFLENGVSDAAYIPTLLKQLETLAGNTRNRVIGVRPEMVTQAPTRLEQRRDPNAQGQGSKDEKAPPPEPYTKLNIEVRLVGGYQSTQAFVERLTRFPKIVAVEELQLVPHRSNDQDDTRMDLLDVKLKLTAFIMKEGVPTGLQARADAAGIGGLQ